MNYGNLFVLLVIVAGLAGGNVYLRFRLRRLDRSASTHRRRQVWDRQRAGSRRSEDV